MNDQRPETTPHFWTRYAKAILNIQKEAIKKVREEGRRDNLPGFLFNRQEHEQK